MEWVPVIALLTAYIITVPAALGVAMRIAGIWRGGWRDIGIATGLGWLALGTGLLVLFVLRTILGHWWLANSQIGTSLIVCTITLGVIARALRRRGRSVRAALLYVLLLAAIWVAVSVSERIFWPNTRYGKVERVDDDGVIWVRMEDGSLVGQRMYEQSDKADSTNH